MKYASERPDDMEEPDEYSVYQFFEDDMLYECVRSHVSLEDAVTASKHYCSSVGAKFGATQRVIITDSDDYCVFEWQFGKGITFPPPAAFQNG